MTQETDGGFVGGTPEFSLGKVEGVEESNNRVALLGQSLKVSLGLLDSNRVAALLGRGESGGRSGKGKDGNSGLHLDQGI